MKKFSLAAVMSVLMFLVFASFALAEDTYLARKVFTGTGSVQRYVDFNFVVPSGDCGNLEIYEFKKSYYPYTEPAHWQLKNPGETARKGFYRFVNNETVCPTKFSVTGSLDFVEQMETWQVIEIEPREIGLFAKGKWKEINFFNLSEDDTSYSYYLLMPGYGMNTSLATITSANEYIYMYGDFSGVIVGDPRGFLNKVVTGTDLKNFLKKYIIRDDEIIILIYHE